MLDESPSGGRTVREGTMITRARGLPVLGVAT
jgi:hypothetical protein